MRTEAKCSGKEKGTAAGSTTHGLMKHISTSENRGEIILGVSVYLCFVGGSLLLLFLIRPTFNRITHCLYFEEAKPTELCFDKTCLTLLTFLAVVSN